MAWRRFIMTPHRLKREVATGDVGTKLITYSLTLESLDQLESVAKK